MNRIKQAAFAAAATLIAGPALAQGKLPAAVAWTAYDVGSAGYNQAVAIGGVLKNELGINLRVLPGKNDVSRQIPLREGKVHFSATGLGASFFAQEGMFEFGEKAWGPQAVRLLLAANADSNLTIGAANDVGIKTIADLKGKRVAWVVGAPSLNQNIAAILRFANLTWDDVKKVEFPGFGAAWDGIVNNQVDAAFATTTSGQAYRLEASPRGLIWPPLPFNDKEGWARLNEAAPFFIQNLATEGAGLSATKTHEGPSYPYPILLAYETQDKALVHAMTKAMVELFPKYKDSAPGINGWALDRQKFDWVVPYHDGAVEYLKQAGVWKPEHDAHNAKLVERQKVLKAAWDKVVGEKLDDAAFEQAWQKARREALEKAGFNPIWR